MKGYLWLIRVNLKLAARERIVIFFNYIFPLIFFFIFGQTMHAEQGGVISQIVTMVLVIGVLGNGLFGGGIRAVQDREQNILRRFKVAPISPLPMLVASIVTGWALYLPAVVLTIGLAHFVYGMPLPERWLSLLVLISAGVVAFRAVGLIIAAVANSAQESQILVQLVYMPMLFLTGTTFSVALLPAWAQTLSQFLPATYLVTGLQGILIRNETLGENGLVLLVLMVTTVLSTLVAVLLFRWEKGEKLRTSAKLWLLAMVFPSLLLGGYHTYSREQLSKTKALFREMLRTRTLLIRDARIFIGDGRTIQNGAVLVRGGKIAEIFDGASPKASEVKAEAIEAAGKTVLPGLIDAEVLLSKPGGAYPAGYKPKEPIERALAAYLYCGITAVRSADPPEIVYPAAQRIARGERLGAQVFFAGPASTGSAYYIPALSAAEAAATGEPAFLSRSLLQQVTDPAILQGTRNWIEKPVNSGSRAHRSENLQQREQELLRAFRAGLPLAAGSGAGNPLVLHGPTVQRELTLWVQAGIPRAVALQAATANAARLMGAAGRFGTVRLGLDADLLVVDGNPLEDIGALERISLVIFKGERIGRPDLFEQK